MGPGRLCCWGGFELWGAFLPQLCWSAGSIWFAVASFGILALHRGCAAWEGWTIARPLRQRWEVLCSAACGVRGAWGSVRFRSLAGVRIWSLSLGLVRQATVGRQGECGPLLASPAALLASFGRRADTPSGGLGWRPDQALRSSGYKAPTFLSFETRNIHPTSSLLQISGAGQGLAARGRAVLRISGSTLDLMLGCGGGVSPK